MSDGQGISLKKEEWKVDIQILRPNTGKHRTTGTLRIVNEAEVIQHEATNT